MELYLKVINKLIMELELDTHSIILIGHSMGGAICMGYFLEYNHVDGLILIGTGAKLRVNPMIFEILKNDFNMALDNLDSMCLYKKTKEITEFLRQEALKTPAESYISDFNICDNFNIMNHLNEVHIPTLILCGEKDLMTPVKYSEYLHEKIENSSLYVIPKSSHDVYIEKADEINNYIEAFVSNI
jgi:pimeloyl-ACP methyl ester carboxylesterase